jgi:hypothetical protein
LTLALEFTTEFCCDNHNNGFDLTKYFPGRIGPPPKPPVEKKKRSRYRPMDQRTELAARLFTWRRIAHSDDPVFRSWPQDWIISDSAIVLLARAKARDFTTPNDITTFLHENSDWHNSWADEIHTIISDYNNTVNSRKPKSRRKALTAIPTEDKDNSLGPESEDEEPELENMGESNQRDNNGNETADNEQELFDDPQDEVHGVRGDCGPMPDGLTVVSPPHSHASSRTPSPDLIVSYHRRARTVTPPESPSAKAIPPRPTKSSKLDNATNTYRRSSHLNKT